MHCVLILALGDMKISDFSSNKRVFSNVVNWWSCVYFVWELTAMLDLSTDSIDQSKKLGWARDIMGTADGQLMQHYVPEGKCEMTDKLVSVFIISWRLLWYVNAMAARQGSFLPTLVFCTQMYSVYSLSCFWLTNKCSSIDAFQDRLSDRWSNLSPYLSPGLWLCPFWTAINTWACQYVVRTSCSSVIQPWDWNWMVGRLNDNSRLFYITKKVFPTHFVQVLPFCVANLFVNSLHFIFLLHV